MALHTVFYSGSVGAGLSNVSISIVGGPGDVVANNQFLPPTSLELLAAIPWGTNWGDGKLETPYLMDMASMQLTPGSITAALASNYNFANFLKYPVKLRKNENVDVKASQVDAGAQTMRTILHFGDGNYSYPIGNRRFRARFTGTTTLTANVWNTVTLTSAQVLPPRRFGVIGIHPRSATGLVMRLDFPISMPGGINFKPGAAVMPNVSSRQPYAFDPGFAGIMGIFDNLTIPTAQWLATAGDTAQTVDLDLITLD